MGVVTKQIFRGKNGHVPLLLVMIHWSQFCFITNWTVNPITLSNCNQQVCWSFQATYHTHKAQQRQIELSTAGASYSISRHRKLAAKCSLRCLEACLLDLLTFGVYRMCARARRHIDDSALLWVQLMSILSISALILPAKICCSNFLIALLTLP